VIDNKPLNESVSALVKGETAPTKAPAAR
jgi:hypothetical protein